MNKDISLPKLSVLDSEMAYREAGPSDAPVALFLHGNPTSSFIWRNIIPLVADVAHCIAPDLIGFGQSGKPDIAYRVEDHVRYLDAFIAKAGIGSAYFVVQDWGTALAFHLAERRPDFVRGLAFMEFIRPIPSWEEFVRDSQAREIFKQVPDARRRGEADPRRQRVRRAGAAGGHAAQADRRRDGGLSRALPNAAVALAHLALSERDTDRGRAGRRLCDDGAGACGARRLDLSEASLLGRPRRARLACARGRLRSQA